MGLEENIRDLVINLHSIGALKFGDFITKVGLKTPVYIDIRVIVAHPKIMDQLANVLVEFVRSRNIVFDHFCGVPYTALPIATLMAVKENKPMLMRRKETKSYGTKKLIDGKFESGDTVLIVEDVVTSGSSILETCSDLKNSGLKVVDTVVVVDRQQGGAANINNNKIKIHSLITISRMMDILSAAGKVNNDTVKAVNNYIADNQVPDNCTGNLVVEQRLQLSFNDRAKCAKCPVAKKLFELMELKKSTLCLAADVTSSTQLLTLARDVGDQIAVLKTHTDIINDFTNDTVEKLKLIAKEKNFLLMEDRKLGDIGNTVKYQYKTQCSWADLVTVHPLPGSGVFDAVKQVILENQLENKGIFVVAELSSKDNLITTAYTKEAVSMIEPYTDIVAGFVCQSLSVIQSPGLIQLTPGVNTKCTSDDLGQQYCSPETAVSVKGADLIVVGRAITKPIDEIAGKLTQSSSEIATEIRDRLWNSYKDRLNNVYNNGQPKI